MAVYGLLGRKLGHSYSPQIHAQLGSAPYTLFEKEPEEVEDFILNGAWDGINVTIPYKRDAARLATTASPRVERTGAANTLVRQEDGGILAENTDVLGFNWLLSDFCKRELACSAHDAFAGRKALVLGSGGASAAIVAALEDFVGAHTVVISRTGSETYENLEQRHSDAALIVNTTPVGMYPSCPASPLACETLAALGNLRAVVDVVYNPARTGLLMDAERLGIPCVGGLAMLVAQAHYASELFQGRDLDDAMISAIVREIDTRSKNIAIIGMPGCGKTTTGKQLARMTSRAFVDLDDAFTARIGRTPAEVIQGDGEDAFRTLESSICAEYAAKSGLVIATGGGIVTRPENYALLHQNSTIVFIDRPLEELSSAGRPLSQQRGIAALAEQRMGLYRSWADLALSCTGSSRGDAEALKELLEL